MGSQICREASCAEAGVDHRRLSEIASWIVAMTRRPRWVALWPAVLFAMVRLLGTALLWEMANLNQRPFDLAAWDGEWYLRIARYGYHDASIGMFDANGQAAANGAMAFFPGYPLLVRAAAVLTGQDHLTAALLVSTVAGVVGAYGVARLARLCGAEWRGELIAVVLVAAAPMSVVYTMAYPAALLVALAAWGLVAILENRWWIAGPCACAAGYATPMGAPLVLVTIAAAGVALWRRQAPSSAVLAAIMSPVGLVGYLAWVGVTTRQPGGFFAITHAGWGNRIDFGQATLHWVVDTLGAETAGFMVITALLIIVSIGLLVSTRRPLAWQVWAYALFSLALAFGSGGLTQDRVRLLLGAFPLLLPAAASLGRARAAHAVPVVVTFALFGVWFGAYSLTVWTYAI